MSTTTIEQGGIAPLAETLPSNAVYLHALAFRSTDQTLVRLVPEKLGEAEELVLATFDMRLHSSTRVGSVTSRAVGFPAWPIMNDPDNAQHALNLVGELEWARKQAENNAGKVKDRFEILVGALTAAAPHFVPTLLEELARIFHEVENDVYAKQYFGKAREVERNYALPIDRERHRDAFIEFAVLGVVGAKEMTSESSAAMDRFEDKLEAFNYLLDVNIERVRAGLAPYAYLLRDLRKAGKIAGFSPDEVDDQLFDEIISLNAFKYAPEGFFKQAVTSLSRYAKTRPTARTVLLEEKPSNLDVDKYLELLDSTGALGDLRKNKKQLAQWLLYQLGEKNILKRPYYRTNADYSQIISEILHAGDAFQGMQFEWGPSFLSLNVADALTECGVQWIENDGNGGGYLPSWSEWASKPGEESRRSLNYVVNEPVLRLHIANNITLFDVRDNIDVFLAHEGAKTLLLDKIDALIDLHEQQVGSIPAQQKFVDDIQVLAHCGLREVAGEKLDALFKFDVAQQFATAVNRGTLAELEWPAFNGAIASIKGGKHSSFHAVESFPAVTIVKGGELKVVDGDNIILEAAIPKDYDNVFAAYPVGDQALLIYDRPNRWERFEYWTGDQKSGPHGTYVYGWDRVRYSLAVDGGRLAGDGLLSTGSTDWLFSRTTVLATGKDNKPTILWDCLGKDHLQWNSQVMSPWKGDASELFQELGIFTDFGLDFTGLGEDVTYLLEDSTVIPVHGTTMNSPMGSVNGVHMCIVARQGSYYSGTYYVVSPLGTFTSNAPVQAAISRPGGGVWLTEGTKIWDATTDSEIVESTVDGSPIYEHSLPLAGWHQLRVVDAAASAAMRAYSAEQAAHVFTTDSIDKTLISTQLNTDNARIIGAVADIAKTITQLGRSYAELDARSRVEQHNKDAVGRLSPAAIDVLDSQLSLSISAKGFADTFAALSKFHSTGESLESMFRDKKILIDFDLSELGHREREIIAKLGSPLLSLLLEDDKVLPEVIAVLRRAVAAEVLGHGYRRVTVGVTVNDPNDEELPEELTPGNVIDNCLIGDKLYRWHSGPPYVHQWRAWVADDRTTVGPYEVVPEAYAPLPAQQFLSCLDALEQRDPHTELSVDKRAAIARGTGLTEEAVTYLFGGMIGLSSWEASFLTKEQRETYGFNVLQAKSARVQVRHLARNGRIQAELLGAAVPTDDPVSYITSGPDVEQFVAAWNELFGNPIIYLKAKEYWELVNRIRYAVTESMHYALRAVVEPDPADDSYNEDREFTKYSNALTVLLHLIPMRPLNDPVRKAVAEKLQWLRDKARGFIGGKQLHSVDFGIDYEDSGFRHHKTPENQTLRLLLEGHLDDLIADLNRSYDVAGCQWDPLVTAPEVVHAAAEKLGVSVDAARYFLQLLALVEPTDANIRSWNGWKTANINNAAAELVAKNLIVEAKRPGAGRSRFLSGGWLPGSTGNKPIEVWKAPHYLLWRSGKTRPPAAGAPPLVPLSQLFKETWERYDSGDTPGYEELKTARYVRKRR